MAGLAVLFAVLGTGAGAATSRFSPPLVGANFIRYEETPPYCGGPSIVYNYGALGVREVVRQHPRRHARPGAARGRVRRERRGGGRSDLLRQTYTSGTSHCGFSFAQISTAIQALDAWARTGVAPTAAAFPAALGFVPGFVPAPWPQP